MNIDTARNLVTAFQTAINIANIDGKTEVDLQPILDAQFDDARAELKAAVAQAEAKAADTKPADAG